MLVCPNCEHQNPDGATQCELCYGALPTIAYCPNCGASVQSNSTFCGQCGYSLEPEEAISSQEIPAPASSYIAPVSEEEISSPPSVPAATVASLPPKPTPPPAPSGNLETELDLDLSVVGGATRLQTQMATLLHLQTNTKMELPQGLSVIHIGKPNEQVPPDIDVSGLPDSDIVSRIHADIRIDGDLYYLEDVGSSNGTYVNHTILPPGNRHRLRSGDRVALGKGDKVTFIFQMS